MKRVIAWRINKMQRYYFPAISILLFILSLIAFSDNLITDIGQESNSDPKFIIHGLFMFTWFGIFVAQTIFILRGNISSHIKWGKIGMFTAVGVFLSTVYVFISIYTGWDAMPYYVKANRLFMLSFAVFILLAYLNRRKSENHKRFICLAFILIIEPIIGRVSDKLMIENWELFYFLVWHTLFMSLFINDWITLKKIHKISWIGLVWFYIVWTISILL